MPSSMIFVSLVVLWLLILVPAVARHRQEVARPSVAALSGRVLERPLQRREPEVDVIDEVGRAEMRSRADDGAGIDDGRSIDDPDTAPRARAGWGDDHRRWERPPPRYRPGRGGFDPEAAALAARARYSFRQRVVSTLLIMSLGTAVVAAVAVPWVWWAHGGVDLLLVGYLVYLRRQVRLEESIRERRAARMAAGRRRSGADGVEHDGWERHGREADGHPHFDDTGPDSEAEPDLDDLPAPLPEPAPSVEGPLSMSAQTFAEPLRDPIEGEPALPRLLPAPPPPLPAGTSLVEMEDDDPELLDLEDVARPDYRRAAGE